MSYKTDKSIKDITTNKIFKNLIINGDFSVWQRGTSFTFSSDQSGYTADRWTVQNRSDGQFTVTKTTLNNKNAIRITVNVPPTDLTSYNYWYGFQYKFERQHLYNLAVNRKNITLSFLFNSNISGEYSISFRKIETNNSGTWLPEKIDSYVTTFNYERPTIPQKIEVTIPLNHNWTVPLANDNKLGFSLVIAFLNQGNYVTSDLNQWISGANKIVSLNSVNWASDVGNFIEISEVQLEEGEEATEFEHIPYDIQLQRCMRYYEIFDNLCGCSMTYPNGTHFPGDLVYSFKVEKRAVPSFNFIIHSFSSTTYTVRTLTTKGITVTKPHTGNAEYLYFRKLIFDAEL